MACKITITCCEPKFKVLGGNGTPVVDPGTEYALYTDFDTGVIHSWNDVLGQWV